MPARLCLLRQVMIIGHLLSVDWLLLHNIGSLFWAEKRNLGSGLRFVLGRLCVCAPLGSQDKHLRRHLHLLPQASFSCLPLLVNSNVLRITQSDSLVGSVMISVT